MASLPAFVSRLPTYDTLTSVCRSYDRPDVLNIGALGRPPMGFGPAVKRVDARQQRRCVAQPSGGLEWRHSFVTSSGADEPFHTKRPYLVYRTPTPRLPVQPQLFGSRSEGALPQLDALRRTAPSAAPRLLLDDMGRSSLPRSMTPTRIPRYTLRSSTSSEQ